MARTILGKVGFGCEEDLGNFDVRVGRGRDQSRFEHVVLVLVQIKRVCLALQQLLNFLHLSSNGRRMQLAVEILFFFSWHGSHLGMADAF